ncbi:MAG: VCBS domain-containing protein [Edaphocola sp.]
MKKFLQLSLLCAGLGIATLSSSCTSEYDATPGVAGRDTISTYLRGDFTATVDGESFVAFTKSAEITSDNDVRTLTVVGQMDSEDKDPNSNKTLYLYITNYQGAGSYPIASGVSGTYQVLEDGVSTSYLAKGNDTTALIIVNSDNGTVSGTFNFTVAPNGTGTSNNHSVVDGKFSIPLE